jgi:integrase
VLAPIWSEKHETATRVRQRIETVFKHAIALDIRVSPNPASKDFLNSLLVTPASAKEQMHQPHLPFERVPAFFEHLRESSSVSAKVLEFKILTNTRNKAAEQAMWSEIDLDRKVWNVPRTSNRKSRTPFECALSDTVIGLVKGLPKSGKYLFPSPYREDMPLAIGCADMMDKLQKQKFKRTGKFYVDPTELDSDGNPRKIVAHGFRSSFRSCMAAKTLFNSDTVEKCMQHDGDKLHQAYQRSNLLEIRLEIMNKWASWCNGEEI